MLKNSLFFVIIFLLVSTVFSSGCFSDDQDEYNVTFTVLYSSPVLVNNTTVILDGETIFQFQDVEIEIYPPILDEKTMTLKKGDHELVVTDQNYSLTKTKTINVKYRAYVDIHISYDEIDISISREPTGFK
jgi:hypothetical protein